MKTVLVTSLSREDCVRRLREAVENFCTTSTAPLSSWPARGSIGKRSLRIRKNIHPARNSFQTRLYGRMEDAPDGGTRIACKTRSTPPGIWIFVAFYTTFSALVALSIFPTRPLLAAAVATALFAGGPAGVSVLALWIGGATSRQDALFLIDLVMETLEARPEAAPPVG